MNTHTQTHTHTNTHVYVHIWAHICKHTHTCTHIHTQLQAAAALAPCLKHQAWTCCCSAISCSFIIPCHGRRSPSPHAPRPQKPCRCMFVGSPSTTTATLVRVRMCLSSVIFVSSRLKWPPVIYASLPYQSSPGGKRNPNAHTSSPPPPHTHLHMTNTLLIPPALFVLLLLTTKHTRGSALPLLNDFSLPSPCPLRSCTCVRGV